jgi:hypothetical protein
MRNVFSPVRPDELVERWGYGSYHDEKDLAATESAASEACKEPVVIDRGPNGGMMMYLADSAELQELQLKNGSEGNQYIGPSGEPGSLPDREIISFDGHFTILRWMDPEVSSRYGVSIYARCSSSTAETKRQKPANSTPGAKSARVRPSPHRPRHHP